MTFSHLNHTYSPTISSLHIISCFPSSLIGAHGRYLHTLVSAALLEGPGASAVLAYLNRLLDIGVQYRYLQDRAYDVILQEAARREERDYAIFLLSDPAALALNGNGSAASANSHSAKRGAAAGAASAVSLLPVAAATAFRSRMRVAVTRHREHLRQQQQQQQDAAAGAGATSPSVAAAAAAAAPAPAQSALARRYLRLDSAERAARAAYLERLAVITKQVVTVR